MNDFIYASKNVALPEGYAPSNLVHVDSKYKDNIELDNEAYQQWLQLKEEVASKGYIIEAESGYRSYDYQKQILGELIAEMGEEYAKMAVAPPGHSEHQTGLALDYCVFKDGVFYDSDNPNYITFLNNCAECNYTNSISHKYGFILRYPKGKEQITGYKYEPWHLRYVGKDLANHLYENNLTLDEYYKEIQKC